MYTLLHNLSFIIVNNFIVYILRSTNKQNVTVDFCPNIRQSEQLIILIETSLSPYCVETILNPGLQHLYVLNVPVQMRPPSWKFPEFEIFDVLPLVWSNFASSYKISLKSD